MSNPNPNPTLRIEKTVKDCKPAIRLVVRYATADLRALLDTLGVTPDCTIANCRTIICATPAEFDAVRRTLEALFSSKVECLGKAVA